MTTRITTLIAAIRGNLAELESEVARARTASPADDIPLAGSASGDGPIGPPAQAPFYKNGMSTPDEYGRVKLEAVEAFRAQRGAEFKAANRPIPEWYFVLDATNYFPLTNLQRRNILSNTTDNANSNFGGRGGRAVRMERREDGSYFEAETFTSTSALGNTMPTRARNAADAAQEVIAELTRQLEAEQRGGPSQPYEDGASVPGRG